MELSKVFTISRVLRAWFPNTVESKHKLAVQNRLGITADADRLAQELAGFTSLVASNMVRRQQAS